MDDEADRAVLNRMAGMMVDLAVPAVLPTPATVTVKSTDVGKDEKALEPVTDQTSPVGEESRLEPPPAGDNDPPSGRAAIDGDCAKASGDDGSAHPYPNDSPNHAGRGEISIGDSNGEPVSSGDNGHEVSEETASEAGKREGVR